MICRNGKLYNIPFSMLEQIAEYMNPDIREAVHYELAPCNSNEFVERYCELDESFEGVLYSEFNITL